MIEAKRVSPFHHGEQQVQTRLGVRDKVEDLGQRFIRDYFPTQHREFYEQLPYIFLGTVDSGGRPWASVLVGQPGFIDTPDEKTLRISAHRIDGDPLSDNLAQAAAVGALGIQYEARRRNRFTAKVSAFDEDSLTLTVEQTFGNCPQYIQTRTPLLLSGVDRIGESRPKTRLSVLDDRSKDIIAAADNFYIATHFSDGSDSKTRGADVSHRGGRPGFVKIDGDNTLTFPDFTGNYHFNTIGNLLLNPRAGLLFIDFENGDVLFLTCSAEIIWEGDEKEAFAGAERLVRFTVDEGLRVNGAIPVQWRFGDYSPILERTGSWEEVEATLAAKQKAAAFQDYTVVRREIESDVITSFYLQPRDGRQIPCHRAGEFLPIEVQIPGLGETVRRTYTISNAPNGEYFRLSIKREPASSADVPPGRVSNFFHDHIDVGSTVRALNPRGEFVLPEGSLRPIVFISGGVGITPMISMLEQLAVDTETCGCKQDIWFIHAARSSREHAFSRRVRELSKTLPCLTSYLVYDQPADSEIAGKDYDSAERIDMDLLKRLLPFDDYDFYFCGPPPFMSAMYEGLRSLNIADERIHYEFFGKGKSLRQNTQQKSNSVAAASHDPVAVQFAQSGKEAVWREKDGSLLELAEAQGLSPEYSCRSGFCGTCVTPVKSGDVTYTEAPLVPPETGSALICCSIPKATGEPLILDI